MIPPYHLRDHPADPVTEGPAQWLSPSLPAPKGLSISRGTGHYTEAEYVRATHATQEALWLRQMLFDLGIHQSDPTTIWCDNQSSIALSSNPGSYTHTKHIAIQHHFVHNTIACGLIHLSWIPTEKQVTDILTKDLGRIKHECFCMSMGLVSQLRGGVEHG